MATYRHYLDQILNIERDCQSQIDSSAREK